jgi:adenylosuccinate synthase
MKKIDVLLGLQWGDEGKGKIVDVLTPEYDMIARFQGGPNAGHTLEFNGIKHVLHTIPSGIFHEKTINIIGNGVLIDLYIFQKEIDKLNERNIDATKNLKISKKAHLILPSHRLLDTVYEQSKGNSKIGSTLKGIGPAYTDRTARNGLRIGDTQRINFIEKYNHLKNLHLEIIKQHQVKIADLLIENMSFAEYEQKWLSVIENLNKFDLIDSEYFINQALKDNKSILAEGAQGSLLDIDFGSYPFVTSSNTITAGVCSGLGVSPDKIGKVLGVFKAYCTRVGSGPFPTELFDKDGEKIRDIGREFGSTTGRPRRCGWLDLPALNYAIMLNGVTELIVTKTDVLNSFEELKVCTSYEFEKKTINYIPFEAEENLLKPNFEQISGWNSNINEIKTYNQFPEKLKNYLQFIESNVNIPISIVSNGPDRTQTIFRDSK